MFESCSICSDPGSARCSMNIIQEKPSTILNLMEKAIRNNRNTGEIHYERSILGDIYHCDHDCSSRGMLAAYSEPNLFRSASSSPVKGISRLLPVDIHEFEPENELEQSDSGFPGTPNQADDLSLPSSIPSPIGSNKSNPNIVCNVLTDENQSPQPQPNRSMSDCVRQSSLSTGESLLDYARRHSDGPQHTSGPKRLIYSTISTNSSSRQNSWDENVVQYSTVQVTPIESPDVHSAYQDDYFKKQEEGIYDIPNCEPTYWEVNDKFIPSLETSSAKRSSITSSRSQSAALVYPVSPSKSLAQNSYTPGSDRQDREDDFEELPPMIPKHHRKQRPRDKELVKIEPSGNFRPRLQSSGAVLDSPIRRVSADDVSRQMGSMDSLDQVGKNRSNSVFTPNTDITRHLQEQEKILDRLLANTRRQRSDGEVFSRSFKPYQDPDLLDDPVYSAPTNNKVMTRVAANNVRGYAYKVQIPQKKTQYDVPRKGAPAPDLTNLRSDAPPRPIRL